MTAIQRVGARSLGSTDQSSQSLAQHGYFIAAVAILVAFVMLRLVVLRRRNRALSDFFRFRSTSQYPYDPRPPSGHNYDSAQRGRGVHLAPLPAAYFSNRRVRAADVDAEGRRLGPAGEDGDGKDILPAYDNLDRPPKYVEARWSHREPMEPSVIIPSPEGEQSGASAPSRY